MSTKITLSQITSRGISAINDNFSIIANYLDNVISRNGDTPNSMSADFDLDGNDILNVGTVNADDILIDGSSIQDTVQQAIDAASNASVSEDILESVSSTVETRVVATQGQTVFTVALYAPGTGNVGVYVDGVRLDSTEYTETDSTTITLNTGINAGQVFTAYTRDFVDGRYTTLLSGGLDASASQTVVDVETLLGAKYTVGNKSLAVFVNGVFQEVGVHYNEDSVGTNITFTDSLDAGDRVSVISSTVSTADIGLKDTKVATGSSLFGSTIGAGVTQTHTVSVPGVNADEWVVSFNAASAMYIDGIVFDAYVDTDEVVIRGHNITAGTLTPPATDVKVKCFKVT